MNVDYSLYEGMEVTGKVTSVISRGKVIVDEAKYVGRPGDERFFKRGPSGRG